jgi:hypothetical protein
VRLQRPGPDAERAEDLSGRAADLLPERAEQVLDADGRGTLAIGVALGAPQQIEEPRGQIRGLLRAGRGCERALHCEAHLL